MDWEIEERLIPEIGRRYEVWVRGNVREVVVTPWAGLRFTDCFSPLQNAFCDVHVVEAWRTQIDVDGRNRTS